MIFWLVLKLGISYYRVIIFLKEFSFFLEDFYFLRLLYFRMLKYLIFHNSAFCLKIRFICKWQGHVWGGDTTPLLVY
jgi:hypothetical protein